MKAVEIVVVLAAIGAALSAAQEDEFGSKVVILESTEAFAAQRAKSPQMFAMFYAPWCGHCKHAKPDYSNAASALDGLIPVTAVDCTSEANKELCSAHGVSGFPTFKFFTSSEDEGTVYDGQRDVDSLVSYAKQHYKTPLEELDVAKLKKMRVRALKALLTERGVECVGCTEKEEVIAKVVESWDLPKVDPSEVKKKTQKKPKAEDKYNGRSWAQDNRMKKAIAALDEEWEDKGEIEHLVDDEFDKLRAKHPQTLTMFYVGWCGHCKALKPKFAEASQQEHLKFSAINCEYNPDSCEKFKVKSYPTLIYFPDGESKSGEPYNGGRTVKALKGFAQKIATGQEPEWENEAVWDENGKVLHLDTDVFELKKREGAPMLVMFYAPWCGHCKAMKPDFADASNKASMTFAAVDCTENELLCAQFEVKGYPTLKYFPTGDSQGEEYSSGRDLNSLIEFANQKSGSKDEL